MFRRNLFAFMQPFKPSAPRQVAAILSVGATLTSFLREAVVEGQNRLSSRNGKNRTIINLNVENAA